MYVAITVTKTTNNVHNEQPERCAIISFPFKANAKHQKHFCQLLNIKETLKCAVKNLKKNTSKSITRVLSSTAWNKIRFQL